ncbi:MAG: hypothetical protein LBE92_08440 [Chryseobacterium sp.]|jgi:hypothetical protein|uniref:hypothetical protein n=1 Tax=Chryseobacterium sp. TaxID=1871047 RepID=UPI00282F3FD2|nr:hypothetical protein [Chryseobacterium sp.]MDR2236138.1 hypothetical protein [Chryseobacterium sp.]
MKITIPKPCHENWDRMSPDEKGRFCSVCSKTVLDFTVSSDEEIINTFSESADDICGNFSASQLNRNLEYTSINSVLLKLAAGFILTTGGLVSVQAQQDLPKDTLNTEINEIVPLAFGMLKDKKMLGSVTVVPASAFNVKETKPEEKLHGVVGHPLTHDSSFTKRMLGGASMSLQNYEEPLCILNGKVSSLQELRAIDPQMVKTVNVLDKAAGNARFSNPKAKNGVIVVTTKKKRKLKS